MWFPRALPRPSSHPAMTRTTTTLVFWATTNCPTVQVPIFARALAGHLHLSPIANNISPGYRQARLASESWQICNCGPRIIRVYPTRTYQHISRRANLSEEWLRRLLSALCSSIISHVTTWKDRPRLMTLLRTTAPGFNYTQLCHEMDKAMHFVHSISIDESKMWQLFLKGIAIILKMK